MMSSQAATPNVPLGEPVYIGTDPESLIAVQIDGWDRGYAAANEATPPLTEMALVTRAARAACDAALVRYVVLDERRFRDVFTLAWSAGYCSALRECGLRAGALS